MVASYNIKKMEQYVKIYIYIYIVFMFLMHVRTLMDKFKVFILHDRKWKRK